MFDILTLNKISNKIYNVFNDDYSVSDNSTSPDAILVRSFKKIINRHIMIISNLN